MTWYEDLGPIDYFGSGITVLRAVGWLEKGKPYPRGAVDRRFFDRLAELTANAWSEVLFCGVHDCDFCGRACGTTNVFIPDGEIVFVAPELILHYIRAHGYQPPLPFVRAVLRCPDMGSPGYLRAIREYSRQTALHLRHIEETLEGSSEEHA